jgi:transposase
VRLISPNYVKPFVKRGKSDAHDARAICEAASRPDMRFVPVKTAEQQAALMQHTSRQLLIDQRTAVANSLRSQFAEFGVIERRVLRTLQISCNASTRTTWTSRTFLHRLSRS